MEKNDKTKSKSGALNNDSLDLSEQRAILSRDKVKSLSHQVHKIQAGVRKLEADASDLRVSGDAKSADKIDDKISILVKELSLLESEATNLPEIANALGLVPELNFEPPEIADIVAHAEFETLNISVKDPEQLVSGNVSNNWPRGATAITNNEAVPVETVGKVRMKINSQDGEAAKNVTFRVTAKDSSSGETIVLRSGVTNTDGYASVNLNNVKTDKVTDLTIVAGNGEVNDDASTQSYPILKSALATHRDLGIAHRIQLRPEIWEKLRPRFPLGVDDEVPGTIEDPDDVDINNSPSSFGLNEEHVDGNCCLRPRTEFSAREYHFRQIVRFDDPDLVAGRKPVERRQVRAPIPFGDESPGMYAVNGGNILLGTVNMYRQGWYPVGRGLGELLYSLALAPCEHVNLAFIDWSRTERDTRSESRVQREQLEHELSHDRSIEEVVSSVLTERQSGSSSSGGGGASLDLGFFSIGGGGGSTSSSTSGRRSLQSSTVQDISDDVAQRSSSIRSQRSTVVTTSAQRESERIQTRTVHNHNKNHAMTVQYFKVLSHYTVKTELVEEKPVVLVPYEIDKDFFDDIPSFNKFVISPSRPITRFLDRHSRILRRMVSRRYSRAFSSLSRLLHCRDVYDIEQPYATFSRWNIRLNKAWRPGITLTIETNSGQSLPLNPRGGSATQAPVEFTSDPIKTDDIDAIRIGFDPVEAARATGSTGIFNLFGDSISDILEQTINHTLTGIEVTVRTDRSRFVPERQSFRLTVTQPDVTLSGSNPFVLLDLTPPTVNFDGYRGREHQDYCKLKTLIAYVQSQPMRFMRALWYYEDPDRRAMRFDRFIFQGQSLLDSIVNKPVGVLGNYVAFELTNGHRLVQIDQPNYVVSSRLVSLPTRGVFAEVFLSCCNATEKRDVERFIDPEQACQLKAPDITGISPGSRASQSDTSASPFAAPIVNLQNAPTLPDPNGTTAALNLLGTPDIFRDLSRGAELLQFINNATKEAFTSTRQHRAAMDAIAGDVVRGLVSGATGIPISGGGSSPTAASAGTTGIVSPNAPGGGSGPNTNAAGSSGTLEALTSQMVRQTSPAQVSDHVQTVNKAVKSGLLSEGQGNAITNSLLGGTATGLEDSTDTVIILTAPTDRDGLAFGASADDKSGTLTLTANVVGAPEGATHRWTRPNPAAMNISDQTALSTTITPLIPGLQVVDFAVKDTSGTGLASIKVPLSVPQFVAVREDAVALDGTLNDFGILVVKQAILEKAKLVCDMLLNTTNVRTIWEMAPFNEVLPAQFAAAGTSANRVSVATVRGNPPTSGLAGRTSPGTSGIGNAIHNEVISVWPGAFDDSITAGAAGDVDDATRQVLQTMQGLDFSDVRLTNLVIEIVGRLIGETLAHEILHALLGFRIPTGHNTPAIADDILNHGTDRSFQNRTGIDINDLPNFPDIGSFSDTGIGFINIPTATTQAHIDATFPISV